MSAYWFKPKHHGYGATPVTWQGWLVTAVFAIALGLGSVVTMLALRDTGSVLGYVVWFAVVLGSVYAFTQFARSKTEGEWAWRWKGQKYADIYDPEKQQSCEKRSLRLENTGAAPRPAAAQDMKREDLKCSRSRTCT